MAKSGDKCEKCGSGRLRIESSVSSCGGKYQIRTLRCNDPECKCYHHEREVVLAESVRRRG